MLIDRGLVITTFVSFAITHLFAQDDSCRVLVQPSSLAVAGEAFRIQPKIMSMSDLSIDPKSVAQVWVQLSTPNESIGVYGQQFANVIGGVANFTNLYVSAPADGLRLTFNCIISGLSIDSDTFQVQVRI